MKRIDLERKLRALGFEQGHGGKHDIWENANGLQVQVPRHREIKERTAAGILKAAQGIK